MEDKKQARRFILTINNAFWQNQFKEVNVEKTNLRVVEDHYNLSYIDTIFCSEYFVFKYIEWEVVIDNISEIIVIKRPFFKDDNSVMEYVEKLNHFRYSCFQVEVGEKEHTEHIQMYINFEQPKKFNILKKYFPTAHFEESRGTALQCKEYCSKEDTRVRGPYEVGTFTEERGRTDYQGFFEMIKSGASNDELREVYPALYMRDRNKIDAYRQDYLSQEYDYKFRSNIEVTYLYGEGGSGKSSYVINKYGLNCIFRTCRYNQGAFDKYNGQKVLVLDEFDSSLAITVMNDLLDLYPTNLFARYSDRVACYDKVYIISNLSLEQQYKNVQQDKPVQYNAFLRRIHNIVRLDKNRITIKRGKFEHPEFGMMYADDYPEQLKVVEGVLDESSKINT